MTNERHPCNICGKFELRGLHNVRACIDCPNKEFISLVYRKCFVCEKEKQIKDMYNSFEKYGSENYVCKACYESGLFSNDICVKKSWSKLECFLFILLMTLAMISFVAIVKFSGLLS